MKTYLLSLPLAELPRLNEKNIKVFLKTFKTQKNLATVKKKQRKKKQKKKRFPTKLTNNKYILNKLSNRLNSHTKIIQSTVL